MALKIGDIGLRAASAVVLAPAAVLATWAGGAWFCALIVAACGLLSFEWSRMSTPRHWRAVGGAVALALIVAVIAAHVGHMSLALILLVFGALAAGLFARSRGAEALDAAYGVLYLGWPCVLLIWLRDLNEAQGLY